MFKIDADIKGLEAGMETYWAGVMATLTEYAPALQSAVANAIRANIQLGGGAGPGVKAGAKLSSRSGALYDALGIGGRGNIYELNVTDRAIEMTTGISYDMIPYWRIHEYGGEILPKRAKALAIPVTKEAADAARKASGTIRTLDLTYLPPSKATRTSKPDVVGVLGRKVSGGFQVWFVLMKRVYIPARPYIGPGLAALAGTYLPPLYDALRLDLVALWDAM